MDTTAIIKLGAEAAEAFNLLVKQLPSSEQRQLRKFYDFLSEYQKEVTREDNDFDDLIAWRERKLLMLETFMENIVTPGKGL